MDATEWRDAIEVLRDPTRICERVMEEGNIPVSALSLPAQLVQLPTIISGGPSCSRFALSMATASTTACGAFSV